MPLYILYLVALWFPLAQGQTPYSLADLEVLAQENSYEEFFKHALDIRPSERQDAWKTYVVKMGDGLSRQTLGKAQITRNDFLKIEKLHLWPVLKSDDVFRLRRQEIGVKYLKQCLKESSPCWDDLKAFWQQDKTDAEIAFKLAELTKPYKDSPYTSWQFLEVSLKSNLSEFYCKKEFVMEALWGKIEIDYIKLGPKGDLLTKIDQTIHPDCMPALLQEAHKRLFSPPKVLDRELAFQVLRSQNKINLELEDFFYVVYLLDTPSQGELFNHSWNRVKVLGGTVNRREAVLKKIKSLDPLPDSIMTSLDQTKKRVVLSHIKTYFPEYLDFYTDQCVGFYGGKGSFPFGNPTINCQEFMNSELAVDLLDDFRIKRFHDVKKI